MSQRKISRENETTFYFGLTISRQRRLKDYQKRDIGFLYCLRDQSDGEESNMDGMLRMRKEEIW